MLLRHDTQLTFGFYFRPGDRLSKEETIPWIQALHACNQALFDAIEGKISFMDACDIWASYDVDVDEHLATMVTNFQALGYKDF